MSNNTNSEKELLARIADLEKQVKQLKEEGYDKEEIEDFEIEIPKGSFYIKIGV